MTIYERLDDETRRKLNAKEPVVHRQQKKQKKRKRKEKLSDADLRYLMGTNRQTYKRVGGKVKSK